MRYQTSTYMSTFYVNKVTQTFIPYQEVFYKTAKAAFLPVIDRLSYSGDNKNALKCILLLKNVERPLHFTQIDDFKGVAPNIQFASGHFEIALFTIYGHLRKPASTLAEIQQIIFCTIYIFFVFSNNENCKPHCQLDVKRASCLSVP